jgi:hypothetical protein
MTTSRTPFGQPSDPRLEKRAITQTQIESTVGTYVISRLATATAPEADIYRFEFTPHEGLTEYPGQWSMDADAVLRAAAEHFKAQFIQKALSGPEIAPGITLSEIYSPCPVQAGGAIDGVFFEYKARGNRWQISLKQSLFQNHADWHYEEAYGQGDLSAGWMTEDEAQGLIIKAAGMWRAGHAGVAQGSSLKQLTVPLMD